MPPHVDDEITQAELERYKRESAEALDLNWSVAALRKSIMAKIDAGASIEPGQLDAEIHETEQRRITNDELVRLLGLDVVEEVRTQIQPTKSRSLKVTERPIAVKSASAKPRRRHLAA